MPPILLVNVLTGSVSWCHQQQNIFHTILKNVFCVQLALLSKAPDPLPALLYVS